MILFSLLIHVSSLIFLIFLYHDRGHVTNFFYHIYFIYIFRLKKKSVSLVSRTRKCNFTCEGQQAVRDLSGSSSHRLSVTDQRSWCVDFPIASSGAFFPSKQINSFGLFLFEETLMKRTLRQQQILLVADWQYTLVDFISGSKYQTE